MARPAGGHVAAGRAPVGPGPTLRTRLEVGRSDPHRAAGVPAVLRCGQPAGRAPGRGQRAQGLDRRPSGPLDVRAGCPRDRLDPEVHGAGWARRPRRAGRPAPRAAHQGQVAGPGAGAVLAPPPPSDVWPGPSSASTTDRQQRTAPRPTSTTASVIGAFPTTLPPSRSRPPTASTCLRCWSKPGCAPRAARPGASSTREPYGWTASSCQPGCTTSHAHSWRAESSRWDAAPQRT